jgi:hypothetical protein
MSAGTKATHTPGPWAAHFNVPLATIPGHIIKTAYGAETPIASLWEGGGTKGKPTQIANARLIAAAPELLAALRELLALNPHAIGAASARAAIAKATGETP